MKQYYIFMKGDKYIGMDNASGGYPYETDYMFNVKPWNDPDQAIEYEQHFLDKGWKLYKIKGFNIEECEFVEEKITIRKVRVKTQ